MRKTDFTKALTEYFSIYLPTTCGVSPNTTNSYRDTFKQLLLFFQEKKGISANYIELRYLNIPANCWTDISAAFIPILSLR